MWTRAISNCEAEIITSMNFRVGTSGYSFEDWRGEFYPASVPKGKMLDYYVQHFETVEINSTYYRISHPKVAANMVAKAPDGFDFMVKSHASFTHEREGAAAARDSYLASIQPFVESGKLAGILAQFPQSFHFTPANLSYTLRGADYFGTAGKLFVEFRHDSWHSREAYRPISEAGLGWVSVDLPALPRLPKPDVVISGEVGYIRFHGRNAQKWHGGGDERYDYNYSRSELDEWQAKLNRLRNKPKNVYLFFNNCYRGQAVRNARELIELFKL